MADEVIENLVVQLEADFSKMLVDINKAVKQAENRLEELEDKAKSTSSEMGSSFSAFGSILTRAVTAAVTVLISKLFELGATAVQTFNEIKAEAISLNAEMESATITFTNMFGNQEEALKFIEDLKNQAVLLGVSFADASRFAKGILPDTEDVEQFNELLRLAAIGSKDAGKSLDELIFSFNEAVAGDFTSMRDLLDLPKDVTARLREAAGDTGVLVDELNKLFEKRGINNLEDFNDTFDTTLSKLEGFRQNLVLIGGESLFEGTKEDLQEFNEFLVKNQENIEKLATIIGKATEVVRSFFSRQALGALEEIDTEIFDNMVDALDDLVRALAELLDFDVESGLGGLIEIFTAIVDTITIVINTLNRARDMFNAFAEDTSPNSATGRSMIILESAFKSLINPIGGVIGLLGILNKTVGAVTGTDLIDWSRTVADATETQTQKTKELTDAYAELLSGVGQVESFDVPEGLIIDLAEADEQAKLLKEKIGELAEDFIDAREKADEKLQKLAEDNQEKIAKIEEDGAEKRADIIEKSADKIEKLEENAAKKRQDIGEDLADDLADLAAETAKKREDIIAGTDRDLADLTKDTNDAVAEQQANFNRTEFQAQEDHKRSMQRLEEDFLDNLEEAVGARDARAIVNLRKQNDKEVRQREEDFALDRQKAAEKNQREIEEAREAERQKAEDLERQRQEELAKLAEEAEEEKQKRIEKAEEEKAELEEKLAAQLAAEDEAKAERLASLDEEIAERREKENEALAERQEAIQEALEARLEAVAKGLLEENEVTEEGAKAILETLNEHFGIGGNVDQLINDFVSRKAEKLRVQLELEVSTSIRETGRRGSGGLTGGGGGRGGGTRTGAPTPQFTFQAGGGLIASTPTTVQFAEAGPELAAFIPLDKLLNLGGDSGEDRKTVDVNLQFSGSAPPGIGVSERDAIAGVLVEALRQSGIGVSATLGGSPSPGIVAGEPKR